MGRTLASLCFGWMLALTAGCSRPAPTEAPGSPNAPVDPPAPVSVAKKPKLPGELVRTTKGGQSSTTHQNIPDETGKLFLGVESAAASVIVDPDTTVRHEVLFDSHRNGKDVYKLTYTVTKSGNAITITREVEYDGKRTVLVEDEYGTLVLQPPTK